MLGAAAMLLAAGISALGGTRRLVAPWLAIAGWLALALGALVATPAWLHLPLAGAAAGLVLVKLGSELSRRRSERRMCAAPEHLQRPDHVLVTLRYDQQLSSTWSQTLCDWYLQVLALRLSSSGGQHDLPDAVAAWRAHQAEGAPELKTTLERFAACGVQMIGIRVYDSTRGAALIDRSLTLRERRRLVARLSAHVAQVAPGLQSMATAEPGAMRPAYSLRPRMVWLTADGILVH